MLRLLCIFIILVSVLPSLSYEKNAVIEDLKSCIREQNIKWYGPESDEMVKNEKEWLSPFLEDINFIKCNESVNLQSCKEIENKIKSKNNYPKKIKLPYPYWEFSNGNMLLGGLDLRDFIDTAGCKDFLLEKQSLTEDDYRLFINSLSPFNFRNAHWGDSIENVKKNETATFVSESSNALTFEDTLFGQKAHVTYIFLDGKLVRAKYYFNDIFSNDVLYLPFVKKIILAYTEKYQKPNRFKDVFIENGCPSNDYGFCVSFGYSNMFVEWGDYNTEIVLGWNGQNGASIVQIEYTDMTMSAQENKKTKEKLMDKI